MGSEAIHGGWQASGRKARGSRKKKMEQDSLTRDKEDIFTETGMTERIWEMIWGLD